MRIAQQSPTALTAADIKRDGADGNHYLETKCPPDHMFSQPVPDFFTCPAQGAFNVFNQYEKFFFPQCSSEYAF